MNRDTQNNYLFVYGTLRKESSNQMYRVLERNAKYLGEGRMKGDLYNLGDYPWAISTKENRFIKGEIYKLNEPTKTFKILDEYEDYNPRSISKSEFKRIRISVEMNKGKKLIAWVYLYAKPVKHLKRIVSGDFIKVSKRKVS